MKDGEKERYVHFLNRKRLTRTLRVEGVGNEINFLAEIKKKKKKEKKKHSRNMMPTKRRAVISHTENLELFSSSKLRTIHQQLWCVKVNLLRFYKNIQILVYFRDNFQNFSVAAGPS